MTSTFVSVCVQVTSVVYVCVFVCAWLTNGKTKTTIDMSASSFSLSAAPMSFTPTHTHTHTYARSAAHDALSFSLLPDNRLAIFICRQQQTHNAS